MSALQVHDMIGRSALGAMGFCFGGLCALDLARSGADLKGVVSLHGILSAPKGMKHSKIKASILVLHGHDDPLVPPERVFDFEKEMTQAQVDWQIHIYGHTMHAFTNPAASLPDKGLMFNPKVAKQALESTALFFNRVLHV